VAALCAAIAVLLSGSPSRTLQKALANLKTDAAARVGNTPFVLFDVLFDNTRDRTVSAAFTYTDGWGDELSGELALSSRAAPARALGLTADLSVYGAAVDFEAYFNGDRAAMRSKAVDDNFYGFAYGTFAEELRVFGGEVGLDEAATSSAETAVKWLRASLDGNAASSKEKYGARLSSFIKKLPIHAENTEIYVAGQALPCEVITCAVTRDALRALTDDFYTLARADALLPDTFLEGFSAALAPFLGEGAGEITLSFYVGRGDRLLHAALGTAASSASVTFGADAADEWVAEAFIVDQNGKQGEFALHWSCSDDGDTYVSTAALSSDLDGFPANAAVTSEWTKSAGDFALRFGDAALRGKLICENDGFRLEFDGDAALALVITARPGAEPLPEVSVYIPLNAWGAALPEKIGRAAEALFGGYYVKRPA
jgi:hypothetical protein